MVNNVNQDKKPRTYEVTVVHPTGYHKGAHTVTVKTNFGGQSVYISATEFGCSRDWQGFSDERAIRAWLLEHGCECRAILSQS